MDSYKIKYPRTPHLPWSPGFTPDDQVKPNVDHFLNKQVIVTEKMDGENTTLYSDYMHARSVDGRHHPSRDYVKSWHSGIQHLIPESWRVCGENMFAQHSVIYYELEHYFYLFSVWDEANTCMCYEDTLVFADELGCATPQVLYQGEFCEKAIRDISFDEELCEGYVVRNTEAFHFSEFSQNIAKFVRPNHVQTDTHWMHAQIKKNNLK